MLVPLIKEWDFPWPRDAADVGKNFAPLPPEVMVHHQSSNPFYSTRYGVKANQPDAGGSEANFLVVLGPEHHEAQRCNDRKAGYSQCASNRY